MKTTFQNAIRPLMVFAVIAATLVGYSFMSAQVWTGPTGTAPANNAPAPLNVGTANQIKNGSVGVNGLSVNADFPTIAFADSTPGSRLLYMQNHSNYFNFIGDRNGDGSVIWADDAPTALAVHLGTTAAGDFTLISNQARAKLYCDENGNNCFEPAHVPVGVSCPANQAVTAINADGTIVCRPIGASAPVNTYAWDVGAWPPPSSESPWRCGQPTYQQSRTVICRNGEGAAVSDSLCSSPKPATTRTLSKSGSCSGD